MSIRIVSKTTLVCGIRISSTVRSSLPSSRYLANHSIPSLQRWNHSDNGSSSNSSSSSSHGHSTVSHPTDQTKSTETQLSSLVGTLPTEVEVDSSVAKPTEADGNSSGTTTTENEAEASESVASPSETVVTTPDGFQPRLSFPFPAAVPSWYAGHMARAVRAMPYLLSRYPPPLVIEVRDARLPLTSINPIFEELLRKSPTEGWTERRLIVYTKSDLIDPQLYDPIRTAFAKRGQEVLFVNTRIDKDVKKIFDWVKKKAKQLFTQPPIQTVASLSEKADRKLKKKLPGAFRYTPTPEEGARLLILGMPNVGKSTLLNALRKVGTGKGKAVMTSSTPGHTKKLTGTVRISKQGPSSSNPLQERRRKTDDKSNSIRVVESNKKKKKKEEEEEVEDWQVDSFSLSSLSGDSSSALTTTTTATTTTEYQPPIYVYDTPGVMVPFLGHGPLGSERGIKLAITAGIKTSLFDNQLMADYLLYRLNLQHVFQPQTSAIYLTCLPVKTTNPTNSIFELLDDLAHRSPGTLTQGGQRNLDATASFLLQRWRDGKFILPHNQQKLFSTELDLALFEYPSTLSIPFSSQQLYQRIAFLIHQHLDTTSLTTTTPSFLNAPPISDDDDDSNTNNNKSVYSKNQIKIMEKKKKTKERAAKWILKSGGSKKRRKK